MPQPSGTIVLAIETSNPSSAPRSGAGTVAVGRVDDTCRRGFRLLAVGRLRPAARHDDALIRAVDDACRAAGVAPRRLGRVAVSIGPGGFTSLRVAVATAKMLCEATGAAPIAVPTALVAVAKRRVGGRVGVVLATKGEVFWASLVDAGRDEQTAAAATTLTELQRAHHASPLRALVADAHAPASLLGWARTAGVPVLPLWLCATRCLEASLRLAPVDPVALAPLYPREPEAARIWRERAERAGVSGPGKPPAAPGA